MLQLQNVYLTFSNKNLAYITSLLCLIGITLLHISYFLDEIEIRICDLVYSN